MRAIWCTLLHRNRSLYRNRGSRPGSRNGTDGARSARWNGPNISRNQSSASSWMSCYSSREGAESGKGWGHGGTSMALEAGTGQWSGGRGRQEDPSSRRRDEQWLAMRTGSHQLGQQQGAISASGKASDGRKWTGGAQKDEDVVSVGGWKNRRKKKKKMMLSNDSGGIASGFQGNLQKTETKKIRDKMKNTSWMEFLLRRWGRLQLPNFPCFWT